MTSQLVFTVKRGVDFVDPKIYTKTLIVIGSLIKGR